MLPREITFSVSMLDGRVLILVLQLGVPGQLVDGGTGVLYQQGTVSFVVLTFPLICLFLSFPRGVCGLSSWILE